MVVDSMPVNEICNHGQKISRLLILAQLLFSIRETEVDYYHQKLAKVSKLGKGKVLKLKIARKFPENLGIASH